MPSFHSGGIYRGVRGDPVMGGGEVQPEPARHSPRDGSRHRSFPIPASVATRDDWCCEDQPQRSRAIEYPAIAFLENFLVKF